MTQRLRPWKPDFRRVGRALLGLWRPRWVHIQAAGLGALAVFAFAPFSFAPLALLSLSGLFWLWYRSERPGDAFKVGFWYGLGLFGVGASWLFSSIYVYGGAPLPLALLAVVAWVIYLSLFPALAGWLAKRFTHPGSVWGLLIIYPAAWVAGEYLRGHLLGGYPVLNLGTSHILTWLDGYAPLLGVYGVGWALALSAAALVWLIERGAWIGAPLVFAAVWLAGGSLSDVRWTTPHGQPVDMALLQGNIPQEEKWQPEKFYSQLQTYVRMTKQNLGADVIVWPETAVPGFFDLVEKGALKTFIRDAQILKKDILIGTIWREADQRYHNALVNIGQNPYGVYKKYHLVLIGEYYPFAEVLAPLFTWLNIPFDQFSPGPFPPEPMRLGRYHAGMAICFETQFGEELRYQLPKANYFITVSNDAWFAHTLEPAQALQEVQMRAKALGRPFARATNTGYTALIDVDGRIIEQLPAYAPGVLRANLQPYTGLTPFARWGELPLLFLLGSVFGFVLALRYLRRR